MKKLMVFAAAFSAACILSSCGGKKGGDAPATDSLTKDTTAVAATETDASLKAIESAITDGNKETVEMHVQEEKDAIQRLLEAGKTEEAAARLAALQKILKENTAKIKEIYQGDATALEVINTVASLPSVDELKTKAANAVADAAKEEVNNQVNAVKDAATGKANEVKEKASEKVDAAKKKASEKVDQAKQAAGKKIDEGLKKLGL